MPTLQEICDYAWLTQTPRTLASGAPATHTDLLGAVCDAIWQNGTRTLTTDAASTSKGRVIGAGVF